MLDTNVDLWRMTLVLGYNNITDSDLLQLYNRISNQSNNDKWLLVGTVLAFQTHPFWFSIFYSNSFDFYYFYTDYGPDKP